MPDLSNIYARVTQHIIDDLEKGVRPWHKPWKNNPGAELPLRHNGEPYRGINILILLSEGMDKGYANRTWMTFNVLCQKGLCGEAHSGALSISYPSSILVTGLGEK